MDSRLLYRAAILGGAVSALTDAVPLLNIVNCLCCLGIASGGIVAVLYLRSQGINRPFTMPEIFRIGLLTGIFGAFGAFLFHYLVFQMVGNWQIQWITNMIDHMAEVPPMWEDIYEKLQSPEFQGFAGWSILIRSLIIFPVFTYGGALLTNQWLIKRNRG